MDFQIPCRRSGDLPCGTEGTHEKMDGFKGHLISEIKAIITVSSRTDVAMPGGMTVQLQVLAVVNSAFRRYIKQLYYGWFMTAPCFYPSWKSQESQCDFVSGS
jgi:hypothetical protein